MNFSALDAEILMSERLSQHGVRIFLGDTVAATRKQRFRETILERGLDCTIFGRAPSGKPETYAQAFERLMGEPFQPKRKGKSDGHHRTS